MEVIRHSLISGIETMQFSNQFQLESASVFEAAHFDRRENQ